MKNYIETVFYGNTYHRKIEKEKNKTSLSLGNGCGTYSRHAVGHDEKSQGNHQVK